MQPVRAVQQGGQGVPGSSTLGGTSPPDVLGHLPAVLGHPSPPDVLGHPDVLGRLSAVWPTKRCLPDYALFARFSTVMGVVSVVTGASGDRR